jgi:tetratricopeptide (TPR) repeat protein
LLLTLQGKAAEAEARYQDFRAVEENIDNEADFPLLTFLGETARFYAPLRRLDVVEEIERRRLVASQKAFGDASSETARALQSLGNTLANRNKSAEADEQYEKALRIFAALPGGKPGEAAILASRADLYKSQRKNAEALKFYREALDADPTQKRGLLPRIAQLQLQTDPEAAVESYQQLRELFDQGDVNSNWVDASPSNTNRLGASPNRAC